MKLARDEAKIVVLFVDIGNTANPQLAGRLIPAGGLCRSCPLSAPLAALTDRRETRITRVLGTYGRPRLPSERIGGIGRNGCPHVGRDHFRVFSVGGIFKVRLICRRFGRSMVAAMTFG